MFRCVFQCRLTGKELGSKNTLFVLMVQGIIATVNACSPLDGELARKPITGKGPKALQTMQELSKITNRTDQFHYLNQKNEYSRQNYS
jgi:hypothetical protein